jgi:acetyltransferase-like isoleucine patch superfamily enzyme
MTDGRLALAARDPRKALRVARVILCGWTYKAWYWLRGARVRAGRNFRVEGRLTIRGPGTVIFGDDVVIGMHVTPWTYSSDAVIRIGDRCFVNGARFGCAEAIDVGADGLLGECHLMDTNFHSTARDRRSPLARPRVAPIRIGANVWIAAQAGILPGTIIGPNSVVGFGSVCAGEYPSDSIIAGNPARIVRSVSDAQ